jgi:hypothetical protein
MTFENPSKTLLYEIPGKSAGHDDLGQRLQDEGATSFTFRNPLWTGHSATDGSPKN